MPSPSPIRSRLHHASLGLTVAVLVTSNLGCGPSSAAPPQVQSAGPSSPPPATNHSEHWAPATYSPHSAEPLAGLPASLLQFCDRTDGGLQRVAQTLAEHQAAGLGLLESEHMTYVLRSQGVPQVWPRAWSIVGAPTRAEAEAGVVHWLASFDEGGERRCGVGTARLDDRRIVLSVVALDAMADLKAIPTQARLGQWIQLDAALLEPAEEAEVVVLGPRGAPRTVPTTLSDGRIRASFSVDQAGQWKLQVLPTFSDGPRPVLEALIFVDREPPEQFQAVPVPGEEGISDQLSPQDALFRMVNNARKSERLPALVRLEGLDVAAQIHAKAMMEARHLAHDVGVGSPTVRLETLGMRPPMAGENVAHALTVVRSHRALWDSPSHRGNVLHHRFTHVGIGVAEDEDGSVWVCEVFAEFPRARKK